MQVTISVYNWKIPTTFGKIEYSKDPSDCISDTFQPAFTCLKLKIETLEQGVKYVQN